MMWSYLLLLSWLPFHAAFPQTSFLTATHQAQGGRFLERDTGRERVWHGVNVVYKAFPYIPITDHFDVQNSFNEVDMKLLQSLGLNAIRLGVMWPGVEPEKGKYNNTYLKAINDLIDKAAEYGIWSLVDCHQDVLSEKYCGEGVPAWAAQPDPKYQGFPYPLSSPYAIDNSTGFPTPQDCAKENWAEYQFTEQAASAYQTLYDDTEIRAHFVAYWTQLANLYKNKKHVLGYEILNEPWCGDVFGDPALIVPGVADLNVLQPFYDVVNKGIRSADPDNHIVFFESVTWDDFGNGFTAVPGGADYVNTSALSYHFYLPPQFSLNETIAVRMADLKRLNIPGFLTEFDIGNSDANQDNMQQTMAISDVNFQSWLGWEYKSMVHLTGYGDSLWNPDGTVNTRAAKAMSRTYAQAIGGHGISMMFDTNSSSFSLIYETQDVSSREDPILARTTEISVNEIYHYPHGYEVKITPSSPGIHYNSTSSYLIVTADPAIVPPQTTITVDITAL